MKLPGAFRRSVHWHAIWQNLANDPHRVGIVFNRVQTFTHMSVWKFVVIVHGSDMCSLAGECNVITICVETAMWTANVAAFIGICYPTNFHDLIRLGIV